MRQIITVMRMTKERIEELRKDARESVTPRMGVHLRDLEPLLDLADQRLDMLEANRKRVAKRRRKLKKEKRK